MNDNDISKATDPDLRNSLPALRRAAQMARKTAIQTGTHLVVVQDGKILRISPEELLEQSKSGDASSR